MIYTVTLNPSIDYIVRIEDYKEGYVNRTSSEELLYGGKGINTSVVLTHLGVDNTALGFVGGNTGNEFIKLLTEDGVKTDFVMLKHGNTRINVKIKTNKETEINANGPDISDEELQKLIGKLNNVQEGGYVTLAGSVPSSLPKNIYVEFARKLSAKNVNIVLDAEKQLLTDVLMYNPFLIKPNHYELGDIFNKKLTSKEEIVEYSRKLQDMGARNIFVSMAGDGGIFLSEKGDAYFSPAPRGKVINSTGAGDSLIAGFLSEYIRSKNYINSFVYGLCAGSASAFSKKLATKEDIEKLFSRFEFGKIETIK